MAADSKKNCQVSKIASVGLKLIIFYQRKKILAFILEYLTSIFQGQKG